MTDTNHEEAGPVEVPAVTQMGATFAERAAARTASEKAVHPDVVEDKAVSSASTKARRTRTKKG